MKDRFNREIDYLRVSLTEKCNFRCIYCMPEGTEISRCTDFLKEEEYKQIIEIARELGIKKIRFSGGEPLLSPYLENLIKFSKNLGIEDIAVTTNGYGLAERIELLKASGLKRVNISLDSLRETRFNLITKNKKFSDVITSILEAHRLKLSVKINCVLIKGINDDEIVDFLKFTELYDVDIRFIELMPIGQGIRYEGVNPKKILESIPEVSYYPEKNGTTDGYYKKEGAKGRISLINPMSSCFCASCSRLRLTSRGTIKLCLHAKEELNLKKYLHDKNKLKDYIKKMVFLKPEKHNMNTKEQSKADKFMYQIGG